jgi:hypothetical protein
MIQSSSELLWVGNENSVGKFLDQLSDYHLLTMHSAPWNYKISTKITEDKFVEMGPSIIVMVKLTEVSNDSGTLERQTFA